MQFLSPPRDYLTPPRDPHVRPVTYAELKHILEVAGQVPPSELFLASTKHELVDLVHKYRVKLPVGISLPVSPDRSPSSVMFGYDVTNMTIKDTPMIPPRLPPLFAHRLRFWLLFGSLLALVFFSVSIGLFESESPIELTRSTGPLLHLISPLGALMRGLGFSVGVINYYQPPSLPPPSPPPLAPSPAPSPPPPPPPPPLVDIAIDQALAAEVDGREGVVLGAIAAEVDGREGVVLGAPAAVLAAPAERAGMGNGISPLGLLALGFAAVLYRRRAAAASGYVQL